MPPTDGTWTQIMGRVFGVLGGGGMSITGKTLCGDYIYSGHACLLTTSSLFVLEYSPRRWWLYHYCIGTLAALGMISIIIAHEVSFSNHHEFIVKTVVYL